MQKHRKYMLVTMWIAVITFIGAGAVDWGGASYGSSASSVAKVGSVEVSNKEFSRLRSNMFEYYRTQFKGNFDEEMAKKVQLNQQVLNQLIMKALTLNMAKDFDLTVSNEDVIKEIQGTPDFQRDGKFDLSLYKSLLKRIRFQNSDYEEQVRQALLSTKVMQMLQPKIVASEVTPFLTSQAIADKIKYKVLDSSSYKVKVDDKALEDFWNFQKSNYMTEEVMNVAFITQKKLSKEYKPSEIEAFYNKNRSEFLDKEGKVLELKDAKTAVVAMMNDEATGKAANYLYVDWKNFDHAKKGKDGKVKPLDAKIETLSFNTNEAPISSEIIKKLKLLPAEKPYLKAEKVHNDYVVYKLLSIVPARVKSFKEAKKEVLPSFIASEKKKQLQAAVIASEKSFSGKSTPFITVNNTTAIAGLNATETAQALRNLFKSHKKIGSIAISNTKVLLYEVQEQKLLLNSKLKNNLEGTVANLKQQAHSNALIKTLDKTYPTTNYLQ